MERLVPLALAVLAVFALATVAASLGTVSTAPTIESDTTPTGGSERGGGGGGSEPRGTDEGERRTVTTVAPDDESDPETQVPLWQVAAGLALFLVGSAVALYGLTRGDDEAGDDSEPTAPEPTAPAAETVTLGSSVPASNDVYRAWSALCGAVPLDPAGQPPAAVAEAAVGAGYRAEPVAELTDAFCAIRYGDAEPTSERERRARALAADLSLPLEEEP